MLQMRKKTRIQERKKSDLWPPTILKVHFKPFNYKIGNRGHSTIETGQIGSQGGFEGRFIFFKKLKKFQLDLKKSKLIHFKLEKYEISTKNFLKI